MLEILRTRVVCSLLIYIAPNREVVIPQFVCEVANWTWHWQTVLPSAFCEQLGLSVKLATCPHVLSVMHNGMLHPKWLGLTWSVSRFPINHASVGLAQACPNYFSHVYTFPCISSEVLCFTDLNGIKLDPWEPLPWLKLWEWTRA